MKLTKDQIENHRRMMVMSYGSHCLNISDEDVIAHAMKLQTYCDDYAYVHGMLEDVIKLGYDKPEAVRVLFRQLLEDQDLHDKSLILADYAKSEDLVSAEELSKIMYDYMVEQAGSKEVVDKAVAAMEQTLAASQDGSTISKLEEDMEGDELNDIPEGVQLGRNPTLDVDPTDVPPHTKHKCCKDEHGNSTCKNKDRSSSERLNPCGYVCTCQ